jgi:hypothetical protein
MPGCDGTGPLGDPNWHCRRVYGRGAAFRGGFRGFGRGFGWRYPQRAFAESVTLTKEDQKKILEAELNEIEVGKRDIEKKLKELQE